ncbi:MAG: type II toxin-antitoxin system HicB family antitoxin [Solirubrobacteraceae bacterium]
MDLTVEVREEGPGYWAHVVELPGCFASGQALDELREALGEAVGLYLWDRPAGLGTQALLVGEVRVQVREP